MLLGEELDDTLPELQAQAESTMTLRLRAYRPNGFTEDDDGYQVRAYVDEGCTQGKFQAGGSVSGSDTETRYVQVGDVKRPVFKAGLHIPVCAKVPTPSEELGQAWEYVVESLGRRDDPWLLNRRFMVVGAPMAKSRMTARRLDVVEV